MVKGQNRGGGGIPALGHAGGSIGGGDAMSGGYGMYLTP